MWRALAPDILSTEWTAGLDAAAPALACLGAGDAVQPWPQGWRRAQGDWGGPGGRRQASQGWQGVNALSHSVSIVY